MPTKEINVVYEAANHKFPIRIHPQKWTGVERYDVDINGVRELDIIRRSNGELAYQKIMPNTMFFYSDDILIIYDLINEHLASGEVWDHLSF